MAAADYTITATHLTLTFARWGQTVTALRDLNLTVPVGQWVILIGHNGSGKTSLLRAIHSQLVPTRGEVRIGSRPISEMTAKEVAQNTFLVQQDPLAGTAPALTVFENLFIADPAAASAPRSALRERYTEMLRPVGLAERLRQPVHSLSGGERQVLTFLIARLLPAKIILLDEPLAALDPPKVAISLREIRALHSEGRTIIQVSHDERLAAVLGDRTVVLRSGRIAYDGCGGARQIDEIITHWHDLNVKDMRELPV